MLTEAEKRKIALIAILIAGFCFLTYFFHAVLQTGTVFTHLFYIPIILASLWWKRKGLAIAILLAALLVFSHHFLRDYVTTANDYLRALIFVLVGFVVTLLSERIAKAQEKTAHLNRILHAIRSVNQLITREKDRDMLLRGMCNNLIETRGYYNAWIALLDENGELATTAEAGLGKDFLSMIDFLRHGELTKCGQRALNQSKVVVTEDPFAACAGCPLAGNYAGRGAMTMRLEYGEKVYGLLSASIPRDLITYEEEQVLFKDVSKDIAFSLHNTELEEERKQAEEALAAEKERLSVTLRSIGDGVITTDVEAKVILINKVAVELTGWTEEEAVGRPLTEVFHIISEETRERCENPAEKVMATGKIVGLADDTVLIARDGTERALVDSGAPIHDYEGKIIGVVVVFRDITGKKRLEAQFQAAQRMEAIGTLAGGIAHDFNNILMTIQGNASMILVDKTSSHPDYERLKNIEQGVRSGTELTRQLLGFAMGGKYEVKPTDINELIKRSSDMFGRTKKEIAIHTKYLEGIWSVEVDRGQIEQVLLNLYVNAWQAMAGGGELYLETDNVTLDEDSVTPYDLEPGRYVKIAITDTGAGMDEATRQRLFEPFFTTKAIGRGTGLGLASAYGIIKNHGGIIMVDSIKGEGATFTMYLPASEKEVLKEEELREEVVKGNETVLLVDDDEMVLDVAEGILKKLGYKVFVARSGKEAIELYKAHKDEIAIVVLDISMPQMGGGETYDKLKDMNPTIKVLLSSGYSIDGQAREILDRGCNGFIQKPFDMRKLSRDIRRILDTV
jgi:two-component system cell cycle sensor histidine kinase/response regulator CckA